MMQLELAWVTVAIILSYLLISNLVKLLHAQVDKRRKLLVNALIAQIMKELNLKLHVDPIHAVLERSC